MEDCQQENNAPGYSVDLRSYVPKKTALLRIRIVFTGFCSNIPAGRSNWLLSSDALESVVAFSPERVCGRHAGPVFKCFTYFFLSGWRVVVDR